MSNRLKRKLGDLGVDLSSKKANESFCLIGTPLPPLEKSKDTGEFVPLWKQEVRDEKGRRRLHGAFTGGFSAGYFNTVGSKEGWTPSTFVSSRNDRAKQKAARPEDFMDEEDLQDLKDSRILVDTTEEMNLSAGTKANVEESDSIAAVLEASILPSASDSAGARILKKMGWRLGQGIGPRLTLRQKKLQDKEFSSESGKGNDQSHTLEDDEEAAKHTYARRDTIILLVDRKDNYHGIGYNPGTNLLDSLGVKGNSRTLQGPRISAGFGLGALNDADEDDLDIYDGGPNASRRSVAFDHAQDDDKALVSGRDAIQSARLAVPVSFFRDGQPVLKGFVLASKLVTNDQWFPFPDVPDGWKADPRRIWQKDTTTSELQPHPSQKAKDGNRWEARMTADERGSLLGEIPLPAAPRSVFDFISKKDRERLQNVAAGLTDHGSPAPSTIKVPHIDPHLAEAALRGFQPFASDPVKQERYNAYLRSQLGPGAAGPPLTPVAGQSTDEFNKEAEDYAKSATLFKPISGAMAGRFRSAAVIDQGPKIYEGLHTPSAAELQEKEDKKKEEEVQLNPKAHAAKMGMFGPLTREVRPWQPARLLCKRFGVKEPTTTDDSTSAPAPSTASWQNEDVGASTSTFTGAVQTEMLTGKNGPRDLANIGLGEDESQGRDILTYERPTMDVFKAIFASDDEESDEEAEAADEPDVDDKPEAGGKLTLQQSNGPMRNATPPLHPSKPEVINLNTFKPTFIPREGKNKKDKDKDKEKDKTKGKDRDKKERKRKDKRAVLSFEVDENGGEDLSIRPSKERPKKKRREMRDHGGDSDDDSLWVEKAAPEVVKDLATPVPPPSSKEAPVSQASDSTATEAAIKDKGRKRAIDFM